MRILPSAALLLLLPLVIASPAAAQEPRGIVFIVTSDEPVNGADASLAPLALLLGEGFMAPLYQMDPVSSEGFYERWMRPGQRYDVLSRGQPAGSVAVMETRDAACSGLSASGRFAPGSMAGEEREGLAGTGLPEQAGAPWTRDATADERRVLDALAAALFHAHGVDVAGRPHGDTIVTAVLFGGNARPVLAGSYQLSTDEALHRTASAFIIAEEGQNGYRPAFVSFHEGRAPDLESRDYVDAADLDGDGRPDLVVRNRYWEAWNYSILSRTPDGWFDVYQGGGGGC